MAAMAQLRFSPLNNKETLIGGNHHRQYSRSSPPLSFSLLPSKFSSSSSSNLSISLLQTRASSTNPNVILKTELLDTGGNDNGFGNNGGGGGGDNNNGGGGWNGGSDGSEGGESNDDDGSSSSSSAGFGILGLFINGWRSRVMADSQFPFKVLMEEVVGVSSCVLGDMASRPNFGLNELDFVFSTLVVGSILNFTLMYLLAPTMGSGASTLPGFFANCPSSHMFESGAFTVLDRFGTFVYKGTVFAGVGFAAGLVGTAFSNGLIKLRKKMDPEFETPNQAPPTLLNAMTWATHMGLSSNLRYQTLNGVEFLLAKALPPVGFKTSVVVLRCLNNVLGGVSFVLLARMTGSQKSQKVEEKPSVLKEIEEAVEEKVKLLDDAVYQSSGNAKAKQQYARNRQRRNLKESKIGFM